MQVDGNFVNCIAFIGYKTEKGFEAEGTAFFVTVDQDDLSFHYLLSAYHVIASLAGDTVFVRIQRKSGLSPKVIPTQKSDWIKHPSGADIGVLEINWREWDQNDENDCSALGVGIFLTEEVASHFGFGLGSDVFMPTAFVHAIGEKQNTPIVRFGNVAAMPTEPIWGASPKGPAFLIETRSLGGMSGSPVFFHTEPGRTYKRVPPTPSPTGFGKIVPYVLIGILKGAWSGKYKQDFAIEDDVTLSVTDAEFNAGISVVIPSSQILEILNHPSLTAARGATVTTWRLQSGYRDLAGVVDEDKAP